MFRPQLFPPLTASQCAQRAQAPAPSLRRRMAAFLYEGVLLFGVVMVVGFVFAVSTQQRHAMVGRAALQATLFLALSVYFIWFWVHGGQTLAMKTWHLRLVTDRGQPLSLTQAGLRYVVGWLWFAPPLAGAWLVHWHQQASWVTGLTLLWIAAYAALSFLMPQRQFVHDAICRTRVIDTRP